MSYSTALRHDGGSLGGIRLDAEVAQILLGNRMEFCNKKDNNSWRKKVFVFMCYIFPCLNL